MIDPTQRHRRLGRICGLGQFPQMFFHAQTNMSASVELKSVYAYRVHTDQPDMLALVFQISPDPR